MLAVLLLLVLALVVWQWLNTRGWTAAQASVAEVRTEVAPFLDMRRFGIHWGRQRHQSFTYRYEVGGATYSGSEDGAPPASRLTVYYDPAEPARSILERPRAGRVVAVAALSLALLAVGFGVARQARRRREAAARELAKAK